MKKAPDKIYTDNRGVYAELPIFSQTNANIEYISKDALFEWVESEMERLWELLPDADNSNPTQMELRYLGQYMQIEALEDKLNSI